MTEVLGRPLPLGTTPSQTVGPFLAIGLTWHDGPDLVPAGTPGAITIVGRVTDGVGAPVPDALVEIWHADPDGCFPHPDDPRSRRFEGLRPFGRCPTDDAGDFWFRTLKPGRVDDEQAPHVDVTVLARGLLRHLVTRIYFPDEAAANATDPVLGGLDAGDRELLVAVPDGESLRFDVRLQGERETPFFTV